jgi:oxygen-independent coproporphyrinogen-3 oxidase
LKKEISEFSNYFKNTEIQSVFLGGGTPSLLSAKQIDEILSTICHYSNLGEGVEITLETNPGTVDLQKLKEFKKLGINRLSIGVQSFNDMELKFLTRIHDGKSAIKTIEDANRVGFDNINLDLIFNLPKQTQSIWEKNLQTALALPVKHISTYSLILERGTILNKLVSEKKILINNDDFDASLYEFTMEYLSAKGFNQYEVSNFCKTGYECIHNLTYWHHKNYIGFGPSAHSFYKNKRWWNCSGVKQYINKITQTGNAVCGSEKLSDDKLLDEYVMLALRSNGLNLKKLENIYGNGWFMQNREYLNHLKRNNFVIEKDNFIKFTPKGYLLCDEILQKLK